MNEQLVAACESQDSVRQIEQVVLRWLNDRECNLKLKDPDILINKAFERAHHFDTVYVRIRTLADSASELRPRQFCSSINRIGASQLHAAASVLNPFRAMRE